MLWFALALVYTQKVVAPNTRPSQPFLEYNRRHEFQSKSLKAIFATKKFLETDGILLAVQSSALNGNRHKGLHVTRAQETMKILDISDPVGFSPVCPPGYHLQSGA